ncbi:MAG: peptidylprolyl isomerase [Deltaproteobacteria bacterium]|nr:peptidylprolyl isomerase [Deltaproteobacteria bacterium]
MNILYPALACLLLSAPVFASDPVARINGDEISRADVDAFVDRLPPDVAATPPGDLWMPVVERMISNRLIVEEARRLGIQDTAEFVAERARLEDELLLRLYAESLVARAVTQETMDQAYNAWAASVTAEGLPLEVHASHILVATFDEAQAIALRARQGEDFAELARNHSTGPTGPTGGDLGWFTAGTMVAEFEEAAWALAPGEVSDPVETRFGWHVIKVHDRRTMDVPPLAEVEATLGQELARQAITDDLQRLRSAASIEILTTVPPDDFGSVE